MHVPTDHLVLSEKDRRQAANRIRMAGNKSRRLRNLGTPAATLDAALIDYAIAVVGSPEHDAAKREIYALCNAPVAETGLSQKPRLDALLALSDGGMLRNCLDRATARPAVAANPLKP